MICLISLYCKIVHTLIESFKHLPFNNLHIHIPSHTTYSFNKKWMQIKKKKKETEKERKRSREKKKKFNIIEDR